MAFATVAELADYMQRDIPLDDSTAVLALDAATAAIRTYTGQTISEVIDDTISLDGSDADVLFLPQVPVTAVSGVSVSGTALVVLTDVYWWRDGRLRRQSGTAWQGSQSVVVTYTHGYAVIPADVRDVCLRRASRSLDNPAGARQETIGSYSVSFGALDAAGFTAEELYILNAYRATVMAG